jgi:Lipase maturation factor
VSDSAELFQTPPPSLWERLWDPDSEPTYWLTRFAILRLLGLVYLVAFATFVEQGVPLVGSKGLTPASSYLERVDQALGSRLAGFERLPSVFWLSDTDSYMTTVGVLGMALSLAVLLGYANAIVLFLLWFLYLSIVHIGQDWYAFGWEIQLLETGFLAIFLCPLLDGGPFARYPPPVVVVWLFRFLIFRILLGAGLIKLRGDPCWRDLTCLLYHYETQPNPNPLSPVLHFMPAWFHKLGVLYNHLVELVAPFFVFGRRRYRHVAGGLIVFFQLFLIASGNLSFLNWLTLVPALACFDDSFWARLFPRGLAGRLLGLRGTPYSRAQQVAVTALFFVVAFSSVSPMMNLLSPRQVMNTSFSSLHLVNTYGAFGTVGRERLELVFEGTASASPGEGAEWREYEFPCKPTDVARRPCLVTPYHYRLDWLLWFAAMSGPQQYPWTLHLVWKLLENDPGALSLLANDPFPDSPPRYVRVDLYRYHFAPLGDENWWRREKIGEWLPPLSRDDTRLVDFLKSQNWLD